MGLLSQGSPLNWTETKKYADHVRKHGILQFLNIYHKVKDRQKDVLKWGDEVSELFSQRQRGFRKINSWLHFKAYVIFYLFFERGEGCLTCSDVTRKQRCSKVILSKTKGATLACQVSGWNPNGPLLPAPVPYNYTGRNDGPCSLPSVLRSRGNLVRLERVQQVQSSSTLPQTTVTCFNARRVCYVMCFGFAVCVTWITAP